MIHLLVPGLRGPFPRFVETGEIPRLPALETLLARADHEPAGNSPCEVAFSLFDVAGDATAVAPLCHHGDSEGEAAAPWLLCAHPVHLRPDQDRLLAFDLSRHPLGRAEADAFVSAFNRHFREDGLTLLAPHPERWYLALESPPVAVFHGLAEILGRNIDHFLPEGPRARQWRALLNEVQMLFHSLPVNAERESRGQWPVSGLWFSGAGRLPEVPGGRIGRIEWCDAPTTPLGGGWEGEIRALIAGLQRRARRPGPDLLSLDLRPGRAVLDSDFEAWREALAQLDTKLAGLLEQPLCLYDGQGRAWRWRPAMRWRRWRRRRPLSIQPDTP